MSESKDNSNQTEPQEYSLPEKLFEYVKENNYLVFYAIAFFLYAFAFSTETIIGPVKYRGEVSDSYRDLLAMFATAFLISGICIHANLGWKSRKLRNHIEKSVSQDREVKQALDAISAESSAYKELLKPFSDLADVFERQQKIRSRLSRWLSAYPQDDWVDRAVSREFIQDHSPRYIKAGQEAAFRQDIKRHIEILGVDVQRGEPSLPTAYSSYKSIDYPYLYREALKKVKQEILLSLTQAREMDDCTEDATRVIVPFIDVMIQYAESNL